MEPTDPLEREIWRLHQGGDHLKAFEIALSGYTPWLRAWLRRKVGEEQRAKDLFQEVTLKFWRSFKSFRWGSSCKTWLCAIALRELYHAKRELAAQELDSQAAAQESSLGGRLDKRAQVEKIFSLLSEEERDLLVMRRVGGASWEELVALEDPTRAVAPDVLPREANRLRQQYSRLLKRIREEVQNDPAFAQWLKELK